MSSLFDKIAPPPPPVLAPVPAAVARGVVSVLVEPTPKGDYVVSRFRDGGTTSAAVHYTRAELVELIARAQTALEVG